MSDTPRTDASEFEAMVQDSVRVSKVRVVYSDSARQIERELATLRERLVIEEETCRQLGRKFREEESERKQAEQRAERAEALAEQNAKTRASVDSLLAQAGFAEDSSVRHLLACMNFDAARKP